MESKKATNKKVAEVQIERYLVKEIERIGGLCWKFVSPGTNGVPDRIAMIHGMTIFIELKAPGEKIRPLQMHRIDEILQTGNRAFMIDSFEKVDGLIKTLESKVILQDSLKRLREKYDL